MSIIVTEPLDTVRQTMLGISTPFSVGDWKVLPELNRLQHLRGTTQRQLEPRLINLLCYLAANSERVLSREELVNELWPRVIVNENSLTRAVSELRKKLYTSNASTKNYIETIPKRGYRLIPAVTAITSEQVSASSATKNNSRTSFSQKSRWRYRSAISALCFSLVIGSWLWLNTTGILQEAGSEGTAVLLTDKILENEPDYLSGELTLSTMNDTSAGVVTIATPVVSMDEKQYAFIQYDMTGSTIFLGSLGTAIEPMPVFFSNRHLFNLAWSPVGDNLLFAMKPSMTTAAVYSSTSETAELLMLNLNTLETSRLVQDMSPAATESTKGLNLT